MNNAGVFLWAAGDFEAGQKLGLIMEVGINSVYDCYVEIRWDADVIRAEPGLRHSGVAARASSSSIYVELPPTP